MTRLRHRTSRLKFRTTNCDSLSRGIKAREKRKKRDEEDPEGKERVKLGKERERLRACNLESICGEGRRRLPFFFGQRQIDTATSGREERNKRKLHFRAIKRAKSVTYFSAIRLDASSREGTKGRR